MDIDGSIIELYNPSDLPVPQEISYIEEPRVEANILTPKDYVGNIMEITIMLESEPYAVLLNKSDH